MVKNPPAMQETQETWVQFLGQEDPQEKGMSTHSSALTWRLCGQRSLEVYSPRGHKRVGHDLVTKQHQTVTQRVG